MKILFVYKFNTIFGVIKVWYKLWHNFETPRMSCDTIFTKKYLALAVYIFYSVADLYNTAADLTLTAKPCS